jgi:hypothetical protein
VWKGYTKVTIDHRPSLPGGLAGPCDLLTATRYGASEQQTSRVVEVLLLFYILHNYGTLLATRHMVILRDIIEELVDLSAANPIYGPGGVCGQIPLHIEQEKFAQ